ncbi:PLPL2-like protein [Mya arenaria]|uniref:PLPL2-like protein n=1 Tax=Mya arenaria TaxID=6604 RepID=A0ABY7DZP0_MYAAR|nr:PLPL2-like protein [Mya arenaria]
MGICNVEPKLLSEIGVFQGEQLPLPGGNLVQQQGQSMNFSFAGCGFLGIYHVGVASCLRQHAPHLIENCHFAGASAGAMIACCLICDCCLGDCTTFTLRLATKARSFSLGPLHPSFKIAKILREALREVLPDNAHEIATGKLHISLTRVSDRKCVIVSQYNSKEELIQALLCSAHVPLYSGLVPPLFQGVRYVDGGLSDNIPILNDSTVTISPFSGESDICPKDTTMSPTCIYLANTNLLSCVRHLSVRSVIRQVQVPVEDVEPEVVGAEGRTSHVGEEEEGGCDEHTCHDCKNKRQVALVDKLPHKVGSALQEAIDEVNKGLKGYVNRHRSLRLLSILATPWVLPVDMSYTFAVRFLEYLPHLPSDVQSMYRETADLLKYLVTSIRHENRRYTARFTCHLAITEVNYHQIESDICPSFSQSDTSQPAHPNIRNLNFEFAVDLDSDTAREPTGSLLNLPHSSNVHLLYPQHRPRSDSAGARLGSPNVPFKTQQKNSGLGDEFFDTFEQCLHVTNQMESVMAYHYRDEGNKDCFKFEEIFTFEESDIKLNSCSEDNQSASATTKQACRPRSNSAGHHLIPCKPHLECDLEEFLGQRSDIVLQEMETQESHTE